MSLLARFYDPTAGRVLVDGQDVREWSLSGLRSQIGMVFQDTFLSAGTVRENIAFGQPTADEAAIVAAARAANAWEFIEQLPLGLDTPVGERGVQLSEGQKQRLAIARALVRDPRILVLDEPTSALDARSERLLQSALDNLMRGRTMFVIAHRLATAQKADQILVLERGAIVERGTHAELLARGGLYRELFDLQIGGLQPGAPHRLQPLNVFVTAALELLQVGRLASEATRDGAARAAGEGNGMELASDFGVSPVSDSCSGEDTSAEPWLWPVDAGLERYEALKRAVDVSLAAVLLVILLPVLLLCVLAVRLDSPGPVLFRQERIGRRGRPFRMLKFRSMYDGVASDAHRRYATGFILGTVECQGPTNGALYKLTRDSRVTRVGKWLRLTSLDELPQLWNVLRGDMSLVGPRPPLDYEVAHYQPRHLRRLAVRPGITGLWQVYGRSVVTFEQMVEMDLEYIRRRSIMLDLRILVLTIPVVLGRRGAR